MLPAPAQGPLSAAIGRSEEAYWIRGVAAANPSQNLGLRFTNDGVVVASAGSSLRLGLGSLGRTGGPAVLLAAARPDIARNRVTYDRGAVDEWYANGPIGLEQGFDIRSRPHGSGPLTLSIPASGDVRLESARDGAVVLQGPRGRSLLYTGLSADDARGHSLRAWLGHRGASLLIYVDDRTARYPVRIDPFVQQTELLPPGSGNPQFGQSVAVSGDGNTVLIGAPYTGYTATTGQAPGAAYVYVRSGGTWSEQTELVGTGAIGGAFQGSSVALAADGNTAIVGGPSDDNYVGAAWVFTRSGTTWTQVSKLVALTVTGGPDPSAEQGWSVALSGDGATALLGAPHDGGNDVGAAWVFVNQNGTWTQQGSKLTATTNPAQQGYSVALSTNGSTALVGSPDDTTSEGGGAWVYTRSGTTWNQQGSELVGATNLEESAEGQIGRAVGQRQHSPHRREQRHLIRRGLDIHPFELQPGANRGRSCSGPATRETRGRARACRSRPTETPRLSADPSTTAAPERPGCSPARARHGASWARSLSGPGVRRDQTASSRVTPSACRATATRRCSEARQTATASAAHGCS